LVFKLLNRIFQIPPSGLVAAAKLAANLQAAFSTGAGLIDMEAAIAAVEASTFTEETARPRAQEEKRICASKSGSTCCLPVPTSSLYFHPAK
jgi:hypothetical protein